MGRRSHHSINKRQREVKQREKAQLKRERRGGRKPNEGPEDIAKLPVAIPGEIAPLVEEPVPDAELTRP